MGRGMALVSKLIDLEVEFVVSTPKAVLVKSTHTEEEAWLPLSVIEVEGDIDALLKGDLVEITLPESWAEDKGLV
jgi:hypothetical protein